MIVNIPALYLGLAATASSELVFLNLQHMSSKSMMRRHVKFAGFDETWVEKVPRQMLQFTV